MESKLEKSINDFSYSNKKDEQVKETLLKRVKQGRSIQNNNNEYMDETSNNNMGLKNYEKSSNKTYNQKLLINKKNKSNR